MRRMTCCVVLTACLLTLASCSGKKPAEPLPAHLLLGGKSLQKGGVWFQKGCYDSALDLFMVAHEHFSAADQPEGVARALNNIANVYRALRKFDRAVAYYNESAGIYKTRKNQTGLMQVLANTAAALIDADRISEAEQVLDRLEKMAAEKSRVFVPLLNNQGVLLTRKEAYLEAETVLKRALAASDPEGISMTATVCFALGNLMQITGRYQQAAGFLEKALRADRINGYYHGMADDLAGLGEAAMGIARPAEAVGFFKRSIKIYTLIGDIGKTHELMVMLEKAAGEAGMDITVTKLFVTDWLEGRRFNRLCD